MLDESILILAPSGRDAEMAASVLGSAGLHAEICANCAELLRKIGPACGAVLLAEEALEALAIPQLVEVLRQQHPWSDLPVVVLTGGRLSIPASRNLIEAFGSTSNVTVLERPIRVVTLTSTLRVALRARRRQYEFRNLYQQREQVLASIGDPFAMLNDNWCYTYANEQMCELAKQPAEQILGKTFWEIFPGTLGSDLEVRLRRVMKEHIAAEFEYSFEQWNGRWFSFRAHPAHTGVSIFTVDITQRKRIESVLLESERRLHLALNSSHLGMWFCNLPFDRILWDINCRKHFDVTADESVNFERFLSLIHPKDRERTHEAVIRSIQDRKSYDVEFRVLRRNGEIRWLHAIGRAFYNARGEAYRFDGITLDISAQKQTELELERAHEEAIEANRAKDHFLAALSHELRTPLTPVLMAVAGLQQEPNIPSHLREDLGMIDRIQIGSQTH